tara:strand:- start:1189 stop:3414 length:2226 start_codon:yes stop_codon:yes gene_type:complete
MTIKKIEFSSALEERYLSYALSTITHRALPDVRDGLKPVHRRLLFAMYQLRLNNNSGFKKSARIVGDVIGKYHPHGDQSVYEALVRLAQEFSTRYPLVDGQGNFGNIDGDNAAAMRYTEARLTSLAEIMLKDISEDTIDLIRTYDGVEQEPIVLPAAFPNLLANGSTGIAVGMATNIPPHNIGELFAALLKFLKKPNLSNNDLIKIIPGPDFPTGGEIIDSKASLKEAYSKGKGTIRLRANWKEESLGRGQYQIVVNEIPYQVNKSKIIEKISEMIDDKKINYLETIQDESTEDIRIVLIPKNRSFKPNVVMEDLFKNTDLEIRYSINLNAISSKLEPKIFSLKDSLLSFLNHRYDVLKRRSKFRLLKAQNRIEILKGFLIVFAYLNQVIKIIRTEDNPEKKLMQKFKINKRQAEAILAMRLRQLKKLEEKQIKEEHKELLATKKELELILRSKTKQTSLLESEFRENLKIFESIKGCVDRRTIINNDFKVVEYQVEQFETKEPVSVIISKNGWIKSIKGHQDNYDNIKYKEGDSKKFVILCKNNDRLLLFSSLGKFYTINCSKINTGRGFGDPISLMIDKSDNEEIIFAKTYESDKDYLITSSSGKGFFVNTNDLMASTKSGKKVMNLKDNDRAVSCYEKKGDLIGVFSGEKKSIKLLILDHSDIPHMQKGRGVILQKFKNGKTLFSICLDSNEDILDKKNKVLLSTKEMKKWLGKRAQAGKIEPKNLHLKIIDKLSHYV